MNASRFLPFLNLAGCLLITGIILAQWLKERGLGDRIEALETQLAASRESYESEKIRAAALERDIVQLKESIEATVLARREIEESMAKLVAGREALTADLTAAQQEQMKMWESAIAERDAKIRDLDAGLTVTRERLDRAVAKLKAAGAQSPP